MLPNISHNASWYLDNLIIILKSHKSSRPILIFSVDQAKAEILT